MRALVWFRRDLRVEDNQALSAAVACGLPVEAVYIYPPDPDAPLAEVRRPAGICITVCWRFSNAWRSSAFPWVSSRGGISAAGMRSRRLDNPGVLEPNSRSAAGGS